MNKVLTNDEQTQKKAHSYTERDSSDSGTHLNFPEEIEHLVEIKAKLFNALESYNQSVEQYDRDYTDSIHYLANYRHEIDPKEIFQNELAMKQIENAGMIAQKTRNQIAMLIDSPYFARIDFRREKDNNAAPFYIGRFSFSDFKSSDILIFDWRAPISTMFYDCEPGQAGYNAPIGRINGELTRKRQLKISRGELEYVLESAINIQDDVLQRELSHTSDEKMKTIIATIQREQNLIIRNELADTLIIQGVAGSGKTSIALHRIAYLLYRYKEALSAQNVVILSPNKVFADYISNVLPELGEEPIYEMSFFDIAEIQLNGIIQFEADNDPLEINDPVLAERIRFKSGINFVYMMNQYLEYASAEYFEAADYEFGNFKVTKEWILARYNGYQQHPVKKRIYEVSADIYERFRAENLWDEELPKQKAIYKKLLDMFKIKNTLMLYKDFYSAMKISDKLVIPKRKTLEWMDVYPFMYFHAAFEGLKENKKIKHLVIDEMQDYTPAQYAVINHIFKCKKTILGDFGQSLNPYHQHSLDVLKTIYGKAQIVEMNKSYRSTYEIIELAKRIQKVNALEPIERHGELPEVIYSGNYNDVPAIIIKKIKAFRCTGNATLGIIAKTNREAASIYRILSEYSDMQLLTPESRKFTSGIIITSIQMSKGLEFDEVIVLSANKETYYTDYDRKLLYIACTRAMHRLSLIYTGEITAFLK